MRNTVFLAIMSIIAVTSLNAHQAKDNFKNCNPRLSLEEIIELVRKGKSTIHDVFGEIIKDRLSVTDPVTHCQENPIDKGCGKLMAFLLHSSNAYWLWPSPAQKKSAQIVAEYKENILQVRQITGL